MEIKKLKKEKLGGVKRYSLIMICIMIYTSTNAQTISGRYKSKTLVGEQSSIFEFKDNVFDVSIEGDLQTKLGTGNYIINKNILELRYAKVKNQDSSSYELNYAGNAKNITIDVKVLDKDSIPLLATLGLRDIKNNLILVTDSEKNGLFSLTIFRSNIFGYLTIDCMGYYRIAIPFYRLQGHNVKITAYLKPQSKVYIEPHLERYRIIKIDKSTLVLTKQSQEFILEKIN